MELTDTEIAARIRDGQRCVLVFCRDGRDRTGALCAEHRDELVRILDLTYDGDRDLGRAASIPRLYARLDPVPGVGSDEGRRSSGFGSRPPCDLSVVVLRDPRSTPDADGAPLPSVLGVLEHLAGGQITVTDPDPTGGLRVIALCAFLRTDLDGWADAHAFTVLTRLHRQLRAVAGDPAARPVAQCTGWRWDPEARERIECGEWLYLPPPQPGVHAGLARPPLLVEPEEDAWPRTASPTTTPTICTAHAGGVGDRTRQLPQVPLRLPLRGVSSGERRLPAELAAAEPR